MAENSKIQWTKHTWNPLWGCRKVSAGCKFCYAERIIKGRMGHDFGAIRRTQPKTWNHPFALHKNLTGQEPFTERLVFTCSMSDFFILEGDEHRADMWRVIRQTPNLIYQILTKRPERIMECLPPDWGPNGYDNVWLGTSVEDQEAADLRIPILCSIPAKIRFLSVEPLIGPVNLSKHLSYVGGAETLKFKRTVDWVIVGGESGNDSGKWKFRPCDIAWIKNIIWSCDIAWHTPVFVKQFGTYLAKEMQLSDRKGGDMEEWPEWARIRQFPKIYTQ